MRRLILMRHAKSDWHQPGLDDHDRGLSKRGQRAATALGNWLRAEEVLPDEVLCSSALRTRLTYDALEIAPKRAPHFLRPLYLANAEEMLRILKAASGSCVLMIGHNNGIADMAGRILAQTPEHPRFDDYPTGATLVADFDIDKWEETTWGMARMVSFVVPRELD